MQLFLRHSNGMRVESFNADITVEELQNAISSIFKFNFTLPFCSSELASQVFAENSVINVNVPVLGGGKDLTEEDKNLALSYITIKICRDCYSRNSIRATTCRKSSCGHSKNLRLKKMSTGKKA